MHRERETEEESEKEKGNEEQQTVVRVLSSAASPFSLPLADCAQAASGDAVLQCYSSFRALKLHRC